MRVERRLVLSGMMWCRYQALRTVASSSAKSETHYDLLGLKKDCTTVDIKDAFIKLSKELHPDKFPDSDEHHQKFVAVNEAYSVLSRPHLRHLYDAELAVKERHIPYTYDGVETNAPRERVIFRDETLWEMRDRSEDWRYKDKPYYPVGNFKKKLPNSYIAAGAVLFMLVGAIFHAFIAKASSDMAIHQLNIRDEMASRNHTLAREQARHNGNTRQLALLRKKIEDEQRK